MYLRQLLDFVTSNPPAFDAVQVHVNYNSQPGDFYQGILSINDIKYPINFMFIYTFVLEKWRFEKNVIKAIKPILLGIHQFSMSNISKNNQIILI